MKLVKRSEFCKTEQVKGVTCLSDIETGTVFRARIGKINAPHVFIKTEDDSALCIGEPGAWLGVGEFSNPQAAHDVVEYEELNVALVIED